MFDSTDRFTAVPGVLVQHVGDGAVVYSVHDQSYFALNGTGALIWDLLRNDGATLESLVAATLAAYSDAPQAEVHADVSELLEGLIQLGLVQHSTSSVAA